MSDVRFFTINLGWQLCLYFTTAGAAYLVFMCLVSAGWPPGGSSRVRRALRDAAGIFSTVSAPHHFRPLAC